MDLIDSISWPVVRFAAPDASFFFYDDWKVFSEHTPSGVKAWRQCTEYFLIDSAGYRFDLANPRFVEVPRGFSALLSGISGKKFPVVWDCERSGPLSVGDVRALMERDFDENSDVWMGYDLDTLRAGVESADSIAALYQVFGV